MIFDVISVIDNENHADILPLHPVFRRPSIKENGILDSIQPTYQQGNVPVSIMLFSSKLFVHIEKKHYICTKNNN